MLGKVPRTLLKMLVGAVAGAIALVLAGQVIGLFAANCTIVCKPDVAAVLGGVSGFFAALLVGGYEPG